MKQRLPNLFLLLLLLFFHSFSQAQHILNSANKYGLSAADGAILLPLDYDTVYKVKSRYHTTIWVCRKNGKFGLFNVDDKWISGMVFDEIRVDKHSGIVTMRQGDKWGFITIQQRSEDEETNTVFPIRYVTPQYDALWSEDEMRYSTRFLYVKDQKRYGVLSANNGDTIIPIKFAEGFREFGFTREFPLFISGQYIDNLNDTMYVCNPNTNVTMAFHDHSRLEIVQEYSFITSVNNYYDDLHGMVEVYNYETGERLFHVVIPPDTAVCDLHHLNIELLNSKTIKVHVEHSMKKGVSNHYSINCYDIFSGYRHFEYEGPKYKDLELQVRDDGAYDIYRRVNYNNYLKKDIVGLRKTDGSIIWYYERYRKP